MSFCCPRVDPRAKGWASDFVGRLASASASATALGRTVYRMSDVSDGPATVLPGKVSPSFVFPSGGDTTWAFVRVPEAEGLLGVFGIAWDGPAVEAEGTDNLLEAPSEPCPEASPSVVGGCGGLAAGWRLGIWRR